MMAATPERIVFMGSPEFAVPSLRALAGAGFDVVGVVTQPDRRSGRGGHVQPPAVKVAAEELGIAVLQPQSLKDPDSQAELARLAPDLCVVAAYGQLLPAAVLAIPPRGTINVHASLLPRWRGASPIAAAILAGDRETGVSIMQLVRKMDAGPVITRAAVEIAPGETAGELETRLAALGATTLTDILSAWLAGEVVAEPQDEDQVTYCGLIKKSDGRLRAGQSAVEAERCVRAYNPWPVASVGYRDGRLSIWRAHAVETGSTPVAAPGTLCQSEGQPSIAFAGGCLVLDEVQRSGSRRVSGCDFLNGERGMLPPLVGLE